MNTQRKREVIVKAVLELDYDDVMEAITENNEIAELLEIAEVNAEKLKSLVTLSPVAEQNIVNDVLQSVSIVNNRTEDTELRILVAIYCIRFFTMLEA